jgi:type IV pilus assembly protein PilA
MNTPKVLQDQRHPEEGFTLIELLIVMSIVLILTMLAVPQMIKIHKEGDETSAITSVKAIGLAETEYASAYPANGFSCTLPALGGVPGSGAPSPQSAQMLNPSVALGSKDGYLFAVVNCTKVNVNNQDMYTGYEITAVPASIGKSGDRGFCMDENNIIKYDPAGGTNCTVAMQ